MTSPQTGVSETFLVPMNRISDRTIIIGRAGHGQRLYKISSLAMSMASPVWAAMISPASGFREADPSMAIELPDDDPEAVYIILCIAHLQFQHVPLSVTFPQLIQLAVICDKYDCTSILRPFVNNWLMSWFSSCLKPGHQAWLFIAWTFGIDGVFRRVSESLIRSAEVDSQGNVIDAGFAMLAGHLPPGVLGNILKVRLKVLSQLLDIIYDTLQTLIDEKYCTSVHPPDRPACNHIVLALLLKAIHSLQLTSQRVSATNVTFSIKTLTSCLVDFDRHGEFEMPFIHFCPLGDKFNPKFKSITESLPSAVQDDQKRHMEAQVKKLGTKGLWNTTLDIMLSSEDS